MLKCYVKDIVYVYKHCHNNYPSLWEDSLKKPQYTFILKILENFEELTDSCIWMISLVVFLRHLRGFSIFRSYNTTLALEHYAFTSILPYRLQFSQEYSQVNKKCSCFFQVLSAVPRDSRWMTLLMMVFVLVMLRAQTIQNLRTPCQEVHELLKVEKNNRK